MTVCKKCGRATDNVFNLVELKTMVVRRLTKSTRYQAMGNTMRSACCDDCLAEYTEQQLNPRRKLVLTAMGYGAFAAFGVVLVILNLGDILGVSNGAPKVFGLIVAFVSILSSIREMRSIKSRTEMLGTLDQERTRKLLSVELISKNSPKKHNDADITYIDLDRLMIEDLNTLAMEYNSSVSKLEKMRRYIKKGEDGELAAQATH